MKSRGISGIEIDEDILYTGSSALSFDINSYRVVLTLFLVVFPISFILQWMLILKSTRIRAIDFFSQTKKDIKSPLTMIVLILKGLVGLMLSLDDRIAFIKVYGIEIYNFLNLQAKFFASMALQILIICLSILYNAPSELNPVYYDLQASKYGLRTAFCIKFFIGGYSFESFPGLYTFITASFCLQINLILGVLKNDSRVVHEAMFLHNKELSKKHMLVANVAYISNLDKGVSKEEVQRDIAEVLGLYSSDYILFIFPTCSNLSKLYFELEKATQLFNYQIQRNGIMQAFYSTESLAYKYTKTVEHYKKCIEIEKNKPLQYTGRGIIFFYKIGDVENFYRLNTEVRARSRLVKGKSKEKNEVKEPLVTRSILNIEKIYKTFLFRYNDIITKNLDLHAPVYVLMRLVLYIILTSLMLFVSTPNTIIQNIVDIFQPTSQVAELLKDPKTRVLLNLCFPLVTFIFNLGIILSIEQLGRWQKFSRHSLFQSYIIRVAFVYLLLNMFVVPGFSLGTSKSIYAMILTENFSPIKLLSRIKLQENGNFFATFVLQSGLFNFLAFILALPELIKNRFSYSLVFVHLKEIRKKAFLKLESDLYEYGYNYSLCCVVIYIIAAFGVAQPIIFVSGFGFFFAKFFGDFISLTCYFKEQIYANGKFLDMAINRLKFCASLTLFLISVKCYLIKREDLFWLNMTMFAMSTLYAIVKWNQSFDFRTLFSPTNQLIFGREVY
jgi:hypothetical protein